MENMRKHPEWYIDLDYTVPVADNVMGQETIMGCDCNYLRVIEDQLWYYRSLVFNYVKKRTCQQMMEAIKNQELLDGAEKII